jgi:hypothetical protein
MPWQVPVQGEVVEAFAQGGDTCFNHVCIYNYTQYIYIYIIIVCFFFWGF